jgi:NADP-dependent 3-hydroxy acid dehydrogenase YdfG
MSGLEGTVALVTGASSGIGAATAETLAGLGASVALVARRTERIEELAAKIVAGGGTAPNLAGPPATALAISADITAESEARGCVERTVAELGRLDMLVNNAGTMLLGPAVGAPLDEWQRMVEINLLGLMYCTHAALPALLAAAADSPRQVADLVNVSSIAGRFPRGGSAAYNATKFGVTGFSEAIRQEVTKRHVRVSVLEPGAVETELVSHNRPEIQERHRARFTGTRKMEAIDIAETIAFVVTRPWYMSVNELVIRPTEQELRWTGYVREDEPRRRVHVGPEQAGTGRRGGRGSPRPRRAGDLGGDGIRHIRGFRRRLRERHRAQFHRRGDVPLLRLRRQVVLRQCVRFQHGDRASRSPAVPPRRTSAGGIPLMGCCLTYREGWSPGRR